MADAFGAMLFREIASFDVVHVELPWPWIGFSADRSRLAFVGSGGRIETRIYDGAEIVAGPSFALPHPGAPFALVAFAAAPGGDFAVVASTAEIIVVDQGGERRRLTLSASAIGEGHELRALVFDRSGGRLWISSESATETAVTLLDSGSLQVVGREKSAPLPRPALHELHVHPQDDAVLLLAACGEHGSFARVVGWSGDVVSTVPTALDGGGISAGLVGFSGDAARVHLAEADELRTHAWPTLDELSSVPLADDFVSSFAGAVIGSDVFVDGTDAETGDDATMVFDRSAIRSRVLPPPVPTGMWAGRFGQDAIVTVASKGEPAIARVWRLDRERETN